ncbi:two-component system, NtrC family, C4-dicarboxylate transport sensor histidine kinase DctB [Gemmobacter megaterium]|uniref:histidine kinase n=1 Tax=Gemmobacter megaterium TaxID=1086013 RepID=A0A1N7NX95_9RHOB|nr:ATP-binding protein [Gemmobacter megaterium]GGE16043.1 sensor histidine kinase [Gemmobacter megaterium]SIT02953.1 two-component system, NtrC family, C4-dicarboxylate transport sensor histidine kinase DctB [Gemmobacter megaterium]
MTERAAQRAAPPAAPGIAPPRVAVLGAMALVSVLAAGAAGMASWRNGLGALDARLEDRLSITAHGLGSEVERLRHLPRVLGEDPRLWAALDRPGDASAVAAANGYLQRMRDLTGADEVYLVAPSGLTLAASNWNEPGSFVGMNYSFRPYFLQAMRQGAAHYYAIGVTTGRPGAFLSARLGPADAPGGVAVVKMDLGGMEAAWSRAGELAAVADADGVVFLSSVPGWRFRPLAPLDPQRLDRIAQEQRYAGLSLAEAEPLPVEDRVMSRAGQGQVRLGFGMVPGTDWRLLQALPMAEARTQALLVAAVTAAAGFLLSAFALVVMQRRQILRLRLVEADRLEARVEERTRELAAEVEERRRAEAELRRTQESLIHSAKLAVLGRMSAAIVHEVGQSLSALDNNLAAAELHGARGAADRLAPALGRSRSMLRRLQGVVARLRGFGSRQVPVALGPVGLEPVLTVAAELVQPRARELGARLDLPRAALPAVQGDGPRLEQVLTNLMLNALEATARADRPRRVVVAVAGGPDAVEITITDTGPGIPPELLDDVMEPFVTTRTGEGLGLGLYIVQSLLEQMQGSLRFGTDATGTTATVRLPVALARGRAA